MEFYLIFDILRSLSMELSTEDVYKTLRHNYEFRSDRHNNSRSLLSEVNVYT
jgi:hypothetical protein